MIGVVDVGGGLRGVYGAGVFDTCLDEGIAFDYLIGVSAGSANVASFLAGQKGRNLKFYADYSFRKAYMSFRNLLRRGSYLDLDYIYGDALTNAGGEYPLDYQTMAARPETPVSTSSKTSVDTSSDSASTFFSASMMRLSSPPEAILLMGFSASPTLADIRKRT